MECARVEMEVTIIVIQWDVKRLGQDMDSWKEGNLAVVVICYLDGLQCDLEHKEGSKWAR